MSLNGHRSITVHPLDRLMNKINIGAEKAKGQQSIVELGLCFEDMKERERKRVGVYVCV